MTDMINEATIELISEDMLTFESVNKGHFRKENGKFVNKSKEAIDSRKKVQGMKRELSIFKTEKM